MLLPATKRPARFLFGLLAVVLLLSGCEVPALSETGSAEVPTTQLTQSSEPQDPPGRSEDGAEDETSAPEPSAQGVVDHESASQTFADASTRLAQLPVKGRAPKTGYARTEFGQAWADVDRNGCDTRNDILRRDLTQIIVRPGTGNCKVMSGVLADPFTGTVIDFDSVADPSGVQIDHVVALSDAWQKGAQQLTQEQRTAFANDPLNLLAVQGSANQQKSDSDAASWLPKNKAFRCEFVTIQIDVKAKYGLWVTAAELDAMVRVLDGCSGEITRVNDVPDLAEFEPPVPTQSAGSDNAEARPDSADGTAVLGAKDPSAGVAPESKTTCPNSAPIKGNQTKKAWIYHIEGESSSYAATHPERCFATADAALRAGYRAPLN